MPPTFTIADAYREYLPELDMCVCDPCYEHARVLTAYTNPGIVDSSGDIARRYWSSTSDRLRDLTAGRHQHMTIPERAALVRARRDAAGQAEPRFCRTPEDFDRARRDNAPVIARWPMYGSRGDSPGIGIGGAIAPYGHTPSVRGEEDDDPPPVWTDEGELALF
jgi:hypothetical protein